LDKQQNSKSQEFAALSDANFNATNIKKREQIQFPPVGGFVVG